MLRLFVGVLCCWPIAALGQGEPPTAAEPPPAPAAPAPTADKPAARAPDKPPPAPVVQPATGTAPAKAPLPTDEVNLGAKAEEEVRRMEQLVPESGRKPYDEFDFVSGEARAFFLNMLAGDARSVVHASGFPFHLEDRRVNTPEDLLQELLKNLRSKRTDLLTLYGVELLTPAEMEKKYGRPPGRLANFPWRGPRTYVAVANISGRGAVAVIREITLGNWRVIGYHD